MESFFFAYAAWQMFTNSKRLKPVLTDEIRDFLE